MGSRGPLKEPQAQGHREHAEIVVLTQPPVSRPEPPAGLTEPTLASWDIYWASPVASVADEVDLPAIRRLFGLYDQYEKAASIASQALVVKGSVGQIRVNPLAEHMLKLEGAILRLENELGLTPMARARLGLAVTEVGKTIEELNQLANQSPTEGPKAAANPLTALVEPRAKPRRKPVAD